MDLSSPLTPPLSRREKEFLRRRGASCTPERLLFGPHPVPLPEGEGAEGARSAQAVRYFFFFLAGFLADFFAAFFFGAGRAALGSASQTAKEAPVGSTKTPITP